MAKRKRTKRITVVTGSRAEFGLLKPIMLAIADRPGLELNVLVTGMHMVTGTWRDVRDAGLEIAGRVSMQRKNRHGRDADVQAVSRGVSALGRWFIALETDVVLVLGDRIEALAAAVAAQVGGFRLAHVHGGDRAEGVADEAMRHAISKLAHLHFAASATSAKRLVRMGEPKDRVFNVGSPAMDGLREVQPAPDAPAIIIMQHPIGQSDKVERTWMSQTLRSARAGTARTGGNFLVMSPNGDPGCAGIREAIAAADVEPVDHLRRDRWLSLLAGCRAIVGNSSAGLIEAAGLKTACVNIGPRQNGREKPSNVIDCDYGVASVRSAIDRAMQLDLRRMRHPYGDGHTGQRIAEGLAKIDLAKVSVRKRNAY